MAADRRTAAVFTNFKRANVLYKALSPVKNLMLRSTAARRVLFGHALHKPAGISREVAAAIVDDNVGCHGFGALIRDFDGLQPSLGGIDCPVHVAWAEFDRIIPQDPFGVRFPELVPSATFSTVPDVGHVPMYDDPERVVAEIVEHTTLSS
ncbi:alpha/beta hydrolase [Rhodococcus fascians]|nr:alpha/beta hydrolase [Rhodococcus fascians]MBY4114595.1 alpha/beta hydrolase [Rhodococcus fascians]